MEDNRQYSESYRYTKAKERFIELKKFYQHLVVYLVINGIFIIRRIYRDIDDGIPAIEALTDLSNYRLFFWWGVILVFHWISTFGKRLFFSKEWEERKIKEFMNEN